MDVREMFPSKFVNAADLKGREVTVTIERLDLMRVGPRQVEEWVLSFVGKKKSLVLNKTNTFAIAEQLGCETDAWIGKRIKIGPRKTTYGGETVDCVRVLKP